jgi:hypothetical protein
MRREKIFRRIGLPAAGESDQTIEPAANNSDIFKFAFGFCVLFFVLVVTRVNAATYYVSTSGSDSNLGTPDRPFRNISMAYSLTNPGDTVIVMPGTYSETDNDYGVRLNRSGLPGSPITVKSAEKWQAILDGQIDYSHHNVVLMDGDYNVLEGFVITNGSYGGIWMDGVGNVVLNNEIHHNGNGGDPDSPYGQNGIFSVGGTGHQYIGNYIHHNGRIQWDSNADHGLYLCADDELVANNIVTNNSRMGLQIAGYDTVSNMRVYNNVFAFNGGAGVLLWKDVDGVDIRNNVTYSNGLGIGTYGAYGRGVVVENNLGFADRQGFMNFGNDDTSSDLSYSLANNIEADPQFVNAGAEDFRLQSSSPAINSGAYVSEISSDYEGNSRPAGSGYDIGAYQYVGTGGGETPKAE